MVRNRSLRTLLSATLLSLAAAACATTTDETKLSQDSDQALADLQQRAGAPIKREVSEAGVPRVFTMTPRALVPTRKNDPAEAAKQFVADNRNLFQLAGDAELVVTRVDKDDVRGLRHITLQRVVDGSPVHQGAMQIHMDAGNNVFRVTGDDFYRTTTPINHPMLSAGAAAVAAGRAVGIGDIALGAESISGTRTVFQSARTLDPISVEPRVIEIDGQARHAYQAQLSWVDETKQQHMELVFIDAQDGTLLDKINLVNTFTGTAFTQSPGANPVGDQRTTGLSFNGNATASPNGWVDSTRRTQGNNAVSATDLNGNNTIGTNETQPTADANDAFVFPYSPTVTAGSQAAAAVVSAFYLVNDFHDRTYAYGFTESAGNFQLDNFGRGGAANDPVNVDSLDGSGTNNANFATPADGSRPRMQMFRFNLNPAGGSGVDETGDFDPGVIYHENSHGLSNRLVGGGSLGCLNQSQSGGMGEGWGDFLGASFLNDPVVGAYVTGNAAVGIRDQSMANSTFTYGDILAGRTQVHDVGEIWAATLWDARRAVGAAVIEQLVVAGMKLTPCRPSFVAARDGILAADSQIFGGANRCALWTAFAGRGLGSGASSTSDTATGIVTSTAVPTDCGGGPGPGPGTTRNFTSTDVPKNIPDLGTATSVLTVSPAGLTVQAVTIDVNITHTWRGDLVVDLLTPGGQVINLTNRSGGSADNFVLTNAAVAVTVGAAASGTWSLRARDAASADVGRINSFVLHVTSPN